MKILRKIYPLRLKNSMYLKYDKSVPRRFTTKTKLSHRQFLNFRVQWLLFLKNACFFSNLYYKIKSITFIKKKIRVYLFSCFYNSP